MQEATLEDWWNAVFSLCIAKISQGLRIFCNHSKNFAILAKFSLFTNFRYGSENYCAQRKFEFRYALFFLHSENGCPMFLMFLIPNDHVLINYHFVPIVISYFRHFCHFTHWGWLYKLPYNFCNPNFSLY